MTPWQRDRHFMNLASAIYYDIRRLIVHQSCGTTTFAGHEGGRSTKIVHILEYANLVCEDIGIATRNYLYTRANDLLKTKIRNLEERLVLSQTSTVVGTRTSQFRGSRSQDFPAFGQELTHGNRASPHASKRDRALTQVHSVSVERGG